MGGQGPQAPSQGSQGSTWWWLPNAVVIAAGCGLVVLGVFDHDNQTLLVLGAGLVTGAAGHLVGKQSPTP